RRQLGRTLSVLSHHIPHGERHGEQQYHNKEAAQQLFVAYCQFKLAGLVVSHVLGFSVPGAPLAARSSARPKEVSISSGSGNTMVVFFSAPISTSVWRYRS